jgi:hypothetical protein
MAYHPKLNLPHEYIQLQKRVLHRAPHPETNRTIIHKKVAHESLFHLKKDTSMMDLQYEVDEFDTNIISIFDGYVVEAFPTTF